jgi:hypothetical protein
MKRDCHQVYVGGHSEDPAKFDDRTWITATLTEDGRKIFALGHNEYQADKFPGRCKYQTYPACWYNTIVPLISFDGGQSFSRADAGHELPVAAPPFKSNENEGKPRGYFNPTNFVSLSGKYYVLIAQSGFNGMGGGACLFRLNKFDGDWSVFDGRAYVPSRGNPYTGNPEPPRSCEPVKSLAGAVGSIAQVEGTDIYSAFSIIDDAVQVYFSKDLYHWSPPAKLLQTSAYWAKSCADGYKYNYPSVIDADSYDRNFGVIGKSAYLFLVRMKCSDPKQRDLVMWPLELKY